MLPSFCHDTITILRPRMAASRGTSVPIWDSPTEIVVHGCSVQTGTTSEDRDGRTETMLGGTCFMPPGTDILAGDRIAFEGKAYVVQGEPMPWPGATGAASHVEVRIAEWRG